MSKGPRHILAAEDDLEDRFMMQEGFREIGHPDKIRFCEDGQALLDQFESSGTADIGLIVLDLNMPRLNGSETLRILKSDKRYSHIPVVIFSTSINEIEKEICLKLGACAYVTKPSTWTSYIATCNMLYKLCTEQTLPVTT
ncbi:MAG: response regulator [Bacteroidetes bacterium]|nr:response regulator [Bacteroidota bacterium]